MIVAALGYTAEALPGTWPGAFINKARGLGILDTCKTTGNAAAPRQDIACFLFDALTAHIGYVDKDGDIVSIKEVKSEFIGGYCNLTEWTINHQYLYSLTDKNDMIE